MQEEKKLVPKLRFPEFTDVWVNENLSSQIEFIAGYAFKSSQMKSFEGKYQLIKMSNVYKSKLDLERSPSYWGELDSKILKFLLKKNDIILTLTGTVGKKDYGYSVVIPENNRFLLNQRLVSLRAKNNVSDSSFINNLIKTSKFYYFFFAESKGGTGNQSNVGIDDLKRIKLNFPTLPEQKKIAQFLTAVDSRIQNLEKKKDLLEQYKKGVMQKIFKQELRFKNDDGERFPNWQERKLSYYLKVSNKKNSDLTFSKADVLSVSGEHGIVNQIAFQGRSFAGASVHNYGVVMKGDIVYTKSPLKSNPFGIIKVNKGTDGIVSTLYAVYKVKNEKADGIFVDYYFQLDDNTNRYLRPLVRKGAKNDMKINNQYVLHDPVLFPGKMEQIKIAKFLSALDKKIALTIQQIERSKTYKKGLLQQMFV